MAKKDIEAALARGVEVLDRFLALKSWLVFPVLYAACVWAVRRVFDYRERILAWQVWLDPEFVRTKPDGFILDFFAGHERLRGEYADEIGRRDLRALRAAFPALYSVIGLEDAFLKALFKPELDAGDHRGLVVEFASRTARAKEEIRPAADDPEFWKAVFLIAAEAAALGLHLIKDEEVQDMIIAVVKGPAVLEPSIPPEA
ncbi:MAG TPA: hypothetical protein ENO03_01425 [Candidatus Aminicenantes bacterium]|nr:hypothetical protein [Candidatus Aminicenantes bacterium]